MPFDTIKCEKRFLERVGKEVFPQKPEAASPVLRDKRTQSIAYLAVHDISMLLLSLIHI